MRAFLQQRPQCGQLLCDRPGGGAIGAALQRGDEQRNSILNAAYCPCVDHRFGVDEPIETSFERQQVAGKVPAIDRRDIRRRQRHERPRVVPVIEMSAISLRPHQGAEGRFEPVDDTGGAQVAEIMRRERRQQLQPDIGGGRSMRDELVAVFLVVVRDQPVIRRGEKFLEIAPGQPRNFSKLHALRGVQWFALAWDRPSDRIRDGGRDSPEEDERRHEHQARGLVDPNEDRGGCGNRRCGPHAAKDLPARQLDGAEPLGRDPLEHRTPRDEQTPDRSGNRIRHQPALMREKDGRQEGLPCACRNVVALGRDVLAQRHTANAPGEGSADLDVGGESENQQGNNVQNVAVPGRMVHPVTSRMTSAGGKRLRRRLSRIFQREIDGSVFRRRRPDASGTVRHSHRAICQSPRTQRC